ncbi:bifunctional diguanylate cyclase/phosphodiesterase [Dasania marina]|uniref:putative bifunctional diguanylate cyclase/phosphodiesterase n=1 Tax=Dasania marina TaxID=471499 RepID=UPI0030DA2F0C|tara:strand:- start:4648 stop:5907 length:1260 start_codon:yes stop_codon:yes gene_type:complete
MINANRNDSRSKLFNSIKFLSDNLNDNSWLGLLLIDIRDFKTINRAYGYECGDKLLQHVAEILKENSKNPKLVFELGNDEFAIIVPHLKGPNFISLSANRIAEALKVPFIYDQQKILVSVNIGASATNLASDHDLLVLVTEHSLSEAKSQNLPFHIADIKTELFGHSDLALLNDFKTALHENELELYYQPKININNPNTSQAEALLRWKHPTRGMIPPDQFLPLCARLGLNIELTQWVLNTALRHQKAWPNAATPSIAINVSADIIDSPELPHIIENALNIWGTDPDKLTIEITESAIIGDKESGFNNLKKVQNLGVRISIDDFGTGYSSLAYFKHIPANEIKIDRSFIDNMTNDSADRRIVELIVSLAKSFKLSIVAEGIETLEQLALVKLLNCDFAQGYYLSRPIPYDEYIAWTAEQ